jgi:flagellar motor switch protein FliN/FliY
MPETAQAVEEKQDQQDSKTQAQSAEFPQAPQSVATGAGSSIDILLDMAVPVTVTVGKTELTIQKLLQLGPGSVLKLDKPIDAPVDVYLKDTKFAAGQIVVVDERFAVRIKNIVGLGGTGNKPAES